MPVSFPPHSWWDEAGVLTMDLGGSTTYTLSCINSTVPIPDPPTEQTPDSSDQQSSAEAQQPQEQEPAGDPPQVSPSAPSWCSSSDLAAGSEAWWPSTLSKRRRQEADYDEWDDEDEERY